MPHRRPGAARVEPVRARLDVDERRRQLVTLGIELFSTRPYDVVSIDDFARSAGVSKGLLYHYFPTKRDFYVATVQEAARQLLERTQPSEHLGAFDRLQTGLDGFLDYVVEHGGAYRALLRSGIGTDAEVARIVDETREALVSRLIEKAPIAAPGPLMRVVLRGWIGFVEAATLGWLESPDGLERPALRDMLIEVLLSAVQTAA